MVGLSFRFKIIKQAFLIDQLIFFA